MGFKNLNIQILYIEMMKFKFKKNKNPPLTGGQAAGESSKKLPLYINYLYMKKKNIKIF